MNRLKFCDDSQLLCSFAEYYLIGKDFLEDDYEIQYPIANIISVECVADETITNVAVLYDTLGKQLFYSESEIKTL